MDAVQLKAEHMVKLPVIVYNRDSQAEVLMDTVDLRDRLEEIAAAEYQNGGKYIRPIALLQAQPKGKEDATTFEKLRAELINAGIPAGYIAIRTADVNELKNVDLLSPDCPVRYIITVNALKEGWDCPFAYILASLANKTSQVDVEQILGRILRLPYTVEHRAKALNMYKRHKRQLSICVMATTAMAFMFDWDFTPIAEIAVTVASIAMGVYIAAVSALLGSQYSKDLKSTTDRELPSKTLLGVLADYFRCAGFSCILLILTSCLFLIPSNIIFPPIFLKVGSSLSYGVFSSNIFLLWLILVFLVNSLGKSVK